MRYRVVETDNFGGDYPDEKFVGPSLSKESCETICKIINHETGPHSSRYWKVVEENYKLQPGFEP